MARTGTGFVEAAKGLQYLSKAAPGSCEIWVERNGLATRRLAGIGIAGKEMRNTKAVLDQRVTRYKLGRFLEICERLFGPLQFDQSTSKLAKRPRVVRAQDERLTASGFRFVKSLLGS